MSDLKSTVEKKPNILEVHFDTLGNHYFNVFEIEGEKYGRFINGLPILNSRITETKTREEVLGLKRNFDTTDKTDFVEHKLTGKKHKHK